MGLYHVITFLLANRETKKRYLLDRPALIIKELNESSWRIPLRQIPFYPDHFGLVPCTSADRYDRHHGCNFHSSAFTANFCYKLARVAFPSRAESFWCLVPAIRVLAHPRIRCSVELTLSLPRSWTYFSLRA